MKGEGEEEEVQVRLSSESCCCRLIWIERGGEYEVKAKHLWKFDLRSNFTENSCSYSFAHSKSPVNASARCKWRGDQQKVMSHCTMISIYRTHSTI